MDTHALALDALHWEQVSSFLAGESVLPYLHYFSQIMMYFSCSRGMRFV